MLVAAPTDAQVAAATESGAPAHEGSGVMVGLLVALHEDGTPQVAYAGNSGAEPIAAQSVVRLTPHDVGRRVALLFVAGDRSRPVIIGCMLPSAVDKVSAPDLSPVTTVQRDGLPEQVITAQQRLVLRCGEASITLLADGTVHISGRELLSEAGAANRIRGASVHLN